CGFCRAPFARGDRGPDLVCGGCAPRARRAVVRQTPRLIVHGGRLKMFRIAAAGFALALSLTPAAAADKLTVLLDWFVNPDHAPLIVAKQGGFFEKHGLDVELVEPADPNAPPKLVAAGQGGLAGTYQPSLYLQVQEGLPLKRIGGIVDTPLNCLAVLADGPIETVADLKGKKIGYSISGFEDALLGVMLENNGLKASDVEMINVNFA